MSAALRPAAGNAPRQRTGSPAAPSSTVSRIPAAHSTSARRGPAYSSTIASCTIVSSRWVAGLSTGSRPVSAMITITRAANGQHRRPATPPGPGGPIVLATSGTEIRRSGRACDSAKTASRMRRFDQRGDGDLAAGAHAAERGAGVDAGQGQRDGADEQQTDHGEQVRGWRPAVIRWRPAVRLRRSARSLRRRRRARPRTPRSCRAGVIRCLPSCLRMSRHGCRTPPPARPSQRARTCRIRPTTSGAPSHHGADLHRAGDVGHDVHRATTSTISTPSAP